MSHHEHILSFHNRTKFASDLALSGLRLIRFSTLVKARCIKDIHETRLSKITAVYETFPSESTKEMVQSVVISLNAFGAYDVKIGRQT